MTPEDLDQIRAIVREECGNQVAASEQRMIDRQERAMEALTLNMSELRTELTTNIAELRSELGRRMETLEHRFDVQTPAILSMDARMAAFGRAVDQLITAHDGNAVTLAAQQRAISDLADRVTRLENERRNPSTPN